MEARGTCGARGIGAGAGAGAGLDWARDSHLVLQSSSLGSLTEKWLMEELGASFMTHSPLTSPPHGLGGGCAGGDGGGDGGGARGGGAVGSKRDARGCAVAGPAAVAGGAPTRVDPSKVAFVWPTVQEVGEVGWDRMRWHKFMTGCQTQS